MAPKKKKTQLKPVARGFATTSVPKKVVETPREPQTPEPEDNASTSLDAQQVDPTVSGHAAKAAGPSILSATDQALQDLIDKYQDKVEKEIARTVKVSMAFTRVLSVLMCASGYRSGAPLLGHPSAS